MTVDDIIKHYGSGPKAAAAIQLRSPSAIYQWRRKGSIPPLRQIQFEHMTSGCLRAEVKQELHA